MRRTIYPGLVKECVVANVSSAGAATRALRALKLPEFTVLFDTNQASRRRGSIFTESFKPKTKNNRVAPTITDVNRSAALEWRKAFFLTQDEALRDWNERVRQEELGIFIESSDAWTAIHTGLDIVHAEWRRMEGSRFVLRRFTTFIDAQPEAVYRAAAKSLGTSSDPRFGDRSILDTQTVARFDDSHFVTWQLNKLPRGVDDRLFVSLAFTDEENLLIVTRDATSNNKELVNRMRSKTELLAQKRLTLGVAHHFSFVFSDAENGRCRIAFLSQGDPKGNIPSMLMNSDKVGVNIAKG
jgi:hypothetical protein